MEVKMDELSRAGIASYVAEGGVRCPFCHEDDIEGGFVETDMGTAEQKMCCNNCGSRWIDEYELTGIRNAVNGREGQEQEDDLKDEGDIGGPCIYCKTPHDDMEPGPCPPRTSGVEKEKQIFITMEKGLIRNIEVSEDLLGARATVIDLDDPEDLGENPDKCNGRPAYIVEWEKLDVAGEYKIEITSEEKEEA
jgi:hypothetical protein